MSSRAMKNDKENEIEMRRMQISRLKNSALVKECPKEVKRVALGELGNKPETTKDNLAKPPVYKHVKPRVDCWNTKDDLVKVQKKTEPLGGIKAQFNVPKIRITRPSDSSNGIGCEKKTVILKQINTPVKSHSENLLHQIQNIDEGNGNIFLVNDYANNVYNYLFELENTVPEKYLKNHLEITPTMRTILIDWLCETSTQFQLVVETYHLTVALVDRYLQKHPETKRKHLQLVGCTAMFVAAKYEEVCAPEIKDFAYITDSTCSKKQICEMEISILRAVEFKLGQPLSIHFLRRFSKAANAEPIEHYMAKYFIELVSIAYSMVHLKNSLTAAASLYLAKYISRSETSFENSHWSPTLQHYSRYSAKDLQPIALQIIKLIKNAPEGPRNKYYAIYAKYTKAKHGKVSKILNEPKKILLLDALHSC